MTSAPHTTDSLYEEDPFAAGQSLEEELLGKGYFLEASLGSSLAAELHSATNGPPLSPPVSSNGNSKLAANLVESKSRDRERQTSYLRNVDNHIRQQVMWMNPESLRDLEMLFASLKSTLHDQAYAYENPLPAIRKLIMETLSITESLGKLKEIMYVSNRQVQELNSRLRSIAKTVHEVRKDIRRTNKFLEEKDDDDAVVLEKGEVQERVKGIMWGLDDLDEKSSRKIRRMQLVWESNLCEAAAPTSS